MTSTMLNRRTLLKGLAASAGTAILAACAGPGATTAPTTTSSTGGSATSGAGTRPAGAGTAGAGPANMGGGTGGGAMTAVPGGATPAAGGTGPMNAGGAAMGRPGGMSGAPAGSTMGTMTGGGAMAGATADGTPATMAAGATGPTPVGTMGPMGPSLCAQGNIVALGSTALQPIVDAAQKVYTAKCNAAQIKVQGSDSGMGVTQVFNGQIAIGVSDIFAGEVGGIDARQLEDHQVCIQPVAIAANPNVNITNLTQDQVISIFTGKVTNYRDVGGPNQAIVVINRPASSGTRATFKRYALNGMNEAQGKALTDDSSAAVADAIKGTPGAIGYLALASFSPNKDLKVINFNGKTPIAENISDNSYPLWSYGHLYTKGPAAGLAKGLIDYMLSDDVQTTLVPQLGYLPVLGVKSRKTP